MFLLYRGVRRSGTYSADARLWRMLWRVLVATLGLAAGLIWTVGQWDWLAMDAFSRGAYMLVVTVCGVGGYAVILWVLGVRPKDLNHASAALSG